MGLNHCSLLIPTIDKVLNKCNIGLKEIDLIALSIGPGSFTGLRIGVSTAKAFSLATKIPVIGVPTLDAIAYCHCEESRNGRPTCPPKLNAEAIQRRRKQSQKVDDYKYLAPLLDAKKSMMYFAIYESDMGEFKRLTDYLLADIDSVLNKIKGPTLFFGDGVQLYGKYIQEKNPLVKLYHGDDWYPNAEAVARLGFGKYSKGQRDNVDKLVPMYLHPKECNVRKIQNPNITKSKINPNFKTVSYTHLTLPTKRIV